MSELSENQDSRRWYWYFYSYGGRDCIWVKLSSPKVQMYMYPYRRAANMNQPS